MRNSWRTPSRKWPEIGSVIISELLRKGQKKLGWATRRNKEFQGEERVQGSSVWWFLEDFHSEQRVALGLFMSFLISPSSLPSQLCLSQIVNLRGISHQTEIVSIVLRPERKKRSWLPQCGYQFQIPSLLRSNKRQAKVNRHWSLKEQEC